MSTDEVHSHEDADPIRVFEQHPVEIVYEDREVFWPPELVQRHVAVAPGHMYLMPLDEDGVPMTSLGWTRLGAVEDFRLSYEAEAFTPKIDHLTRAFAESSVSFTVNADRVSIAVMRLLLGLGSRSAAARRVARRAQRAAREVGPLAVDGAAYARRTGRHRRG
jgi:hypothetical protein